MNKIFMQVLAVIFSFGLVTLIPAEETVQKSMILPIVEIHDGDTIKTDLTWRLPPPLNIIDVRVLGIDTPEMPADSYGVTGKLGKAKCVKEAEMALQARDLVKNLAVGQTKMKITNFGWDKYARIDANVNIGGKDVATELLNAGLAVPYDGGTKTHDWCL